MKKIPVQEAVGKTICHDITAMYDGFKGPAFRRGHVIREEDLETLLNIGKKHVYIWEENAGEIHEEDCARRLAAMAPVGGAHYTEPSEGKVLLIADRRGMFRVDTELLREINGIGDITIAALPDHYPVEKGARLASMRIVPLVTKEEQILRAEALCRERKLLDLKPYMPHTVGLVITGSEVYSGRIADRFEPVIRSKFRDGVYPAEILGPAVCDDVTPAAIRQMGAQIVSHGVPAQPGNMTLAAYRGKVTILGVPGAAIHRPATILDVLLPQVFAGEPITKEDLIRLGDGGLCQLCGDCHFPNCTFGRY